MDPAATDGELDIRLAIKEREGYDFCTSPRLYRKPGISVPKLVMAGVAVPREPFRKILSQIDDLRRRPAPV